MGPRSVERGKLRAPSEQAAGGSASMGPRSVERGKGIRNNSDDGVLRASMGPRSVERGKGSSRLAEKPVKHCFNGAAFC